MPYDVVRSEQKYDGKIVSVRVDMVIEPDGSQAPREVVEHVDSVAIAAVDDQQRVLLIRQYRQPFQEYLWELPAGLCDKPGEAPTATARRELAEETGFEATDWTSLVDLRPSPGISTESARVYQATGLRKRDRPGDADGEESDLEIEWVPLPEAVARALEGRITNALAVAGLLALAVRLGLQDETTRPADAPWPGEAAAHP